MGMEKNAAGHRLKVNRDFVGYFEAARQQGEPACRQRWGAGIACLAPALRSWHRRAERSCCGARVSCCRPMPAPLAAFRPRGSRPGWEAAARLAPAEQLPCWAGSSRALSSLQACIVSQAPAASGLSPNLGHAPAPAAAEVEEREVVPPWKVPQPDPLRSKGPLVQVNASLAATPALRRPTSVMTTGIPGCPRQG